MNEFFTLDLLIKVISVTAASFAFSVVIKVGKRHLPEATGLAAITYIIYYTVQFFVGEVFLAALVSTAAAALISEALARLKSAPTIVFLLPAVIPTVPGGGLYYAMRDLLRAETISASDSFINALKIALGIAGGIVAVSIIFNSVYGHIKKMAVLRKIKKQ